jgi:hypothetical protein
MKNLAGLICAVASGHFVLCWLVVGIVRWFSWDYFFWLGRELFLPLASIDEMLWPPYNWFTFILPVALNSGVWGLVIGIFLYAVRCIIRKPAA